MKIDQIIQSPALAGFRDRPRETLIVKAKKAAKPILGPRSRLGGFPYLPRRASWPTCPRCRMSLFFIGQFGTDLGPLPLPKGINLLSAFKCANMNCDLWSHTFKGAPFFHLYKSSTGSAHQSPDSAWKGKGIYPPPGIEFDKFGLTSISIATEVGLPYSIVVQKQETDYPGWEECSSWRKLFNDPVFDEYMQLRPIAGIKLLGHPTWIQGPEYPRCRCRRKMKQFIQLDYPEVDLGDCGRMHIFYCDRWCGGVSALAAMWQCY